MTLNTAFMGDGAVIRVADGASIDKPLHLIVCDQRQGGVSIFTRSLVVIGKGATATLIESHRRAGRRRLSDQSRA